MKYKRSIVLLQRDIRLTNNYSLTQADRESELVYPVFIFDDKQMYNNDFFSENAFSFMCEAVDDVDKQLIANGSILHIYTGDSSIILSRLLEEYNINAVYISEDCTPFAKKRLENSIMCARRYRCAVEIVNNNFLHSLGSVVTEKQSPYTMFTPFMRKAKEVYVPLHTEYMYKHLSVLENYVPKSIKVSSNKTSFKGTKKSLNKAIQHIKLLQNYKESRDMLSEQGTTQLSPYIKFGIISVHDVLSIYKSIHPKEEQFISELYWREFYAHVAHHFPHVFGNNFKKDIDYVRWNEPEAMFDIWCEGKTGFPIVDAGMRELRTTGWMHNRARMITASFLTKQLHIHWKHGEKFFAQNLVDYDPSSNNGGWQWCASTGVDAQPYFRVFNPWLQQKKFDTDCLYIKKWLPELSLCTPEQIHNLENKDCTQGKYPRPIVDHATEREEAIQRFKK